ncbi:DNA methyltransferase (plasmid) [Pediococcus pentosaceus]|uniref:class I SAM-dependent DNA methyltransferase n=1 Tax=Pediococcus pentosaceus TaxID=1255 RepID=UPI0030CEAB64
MANTEYEDQIQSIINEPNHEGFVYDFLSVYEKIPKATITKLRKGLNNLSKEPGEVYLKNKLYFKQTDSDLMQAYVDVQVRVNELGTKPRFIIVTDYKQLLAKDTKTHDSLDIEFSKLPQKFKFFLAWNGIEKADSDKEYPADIRAAERFAKLYDVVVKDNPHASRKGLNLFLIRVLFCLFAEDTNIFENNLFTNRVKQMTKEDGTDFDAFVSQLFGVLDFEKSQRPVDTPSWLNDFPYVDGDLFKDPHESLMFSSKSRKLIIDAGELLNWNQVNPDILGSMIQAVASEDSRSHLGMHYTSVPNIMKVIKPLFLDGLREDFEAAKGNEDKLQKLYDRIGNIKFMDPACGSGNFLIITYKELRQLEIDILKELNRMGIATMYVPSVTLDQFYGIEIDDFACDVTRLSLWIAEHQMNKQLEKAIDNAVRPTLPLQHAGAIVCGNALRLDWNEVLPHEKDEEVYLFGNPPYLGHSKQDKLKKNDIRQLFKGIKGAGYLDYISGWFLLGAKCISNTNGKFAFVSTNSISEGEQVAILWEQLLKKVNIEFAYKSFKWKNNAKNNAGVSVIIIGCISKHKKCVKRLFSKNSFMNVDNISPYLIAYNNTIVKDLSRPLTIRPDMQFGNKPTDGGGLILNEEEYHDAIRKWPHLKPYIKFYMGSDELIKGKTRYVLWITDEDYTKIKNNPFVQSRIQVVKTSRENSGTESTKKWANYPYKFKQIAPFYKENKQLSGTCIVIPAVSSENREYIPMGVVSNESTILNNRVYGIFNAPLWLFGLLESRMHMVWVKTVGGKLETRYSYSSGVCYNAFPLPRLSLRRQKQIEDIVWKILDVRDEQGGTLAELYGSPLATKNPKPMNPYLLEVHRELDQVVDYAYRDRPFKNDDERLLMLLEMYSKKVNEGK